MATSENIYDEKMKNLFRKSIPQQTLDNGNVTCLIGLLLDYLDLVLYKNRVFNPNDLLSLVEQEKWNKAKPQSLKTEKIPDDKWFYIIEIYLVFIISKLIARIFKTEFCNNYKLINDVPNLFKSRGSSLDVSFAMLLSWSYKNDNPSEISMRHFMKIIQLFNKPHARIFIMDIIQNSGHSLALKALQCTSKILLSSDYKLEFELKDNLMNVKGILKEYYEIEFIEEFIRTVVTENDQFLNQICAIVEKINNKYSNNELENIWEYYLIPVNGVVGYVNDNSILNNYLIKK